MVQREDFRAQMMYLDRHFQVLPLHDALKKKSDGDIDRPTVVITFDDGYQNNHDLALPVLEEFRIPATIYLATGFLDTDSTIWTGQLQHAMAVTRRDRLTWRDRTWEIASRPGRLECLRAVKSELKAAPQVSLMETVAELVEQLTGSARVSLTVSSPYRMLDDESVKRLAESDLVELGAHTHSHHVLSRLDGPAQDREIRVAKEFIESITSERWQSFAYPNGQPEDFTDETVALLDKHDFDNAVTTVSGLCDLAVDEPYHLPRISVDGRSSLSQFKLGIFDIPGRFRN